MKRRKFLKKSVLGLGALGVASGLYSWQVEPFWLEFVKVRMPIKNLPNHLIGKTVMQISDIHVGNRFNYNYIIDSFAKAKSYQPDFVVYTGDFVSYENETQFEQLQEVCEHIVKGKIDTIGVLGNHDYGYNWQQQEVANEISAILENAGVTILSNEKKDCNGIQILGVDDFWGLQFDPEKVMQLYNKNEASLVLCHNPDVCDLDVWNNYKGWILSGHTHGGQCKPPFLNPPVLPVKNKKYTSGKIDLQDGRMLYINRALGNLWQLRFNVRPEITIFTLEKERS